MNYQKLLKSKTYINDLNKVFTTYDFSFLKGKSLLITGSLGLIGSCLIDFLLLHNAYFNSKVYAIVRNMTLAKDRFSALDTTNLTLIKQDINEPFNLDIKVNYIINCASNTHPNDYSLKPIDTILTNVIGLNNMLMLASNTKCDKFIDMSSVEIYGENKGDVFAFKEDYLGYIDCNTLRAGYNESKRLGEALCQAYIKEKGLNISIIRLARAFGPTMKMSDSKVSSQFIKNVLRNEDITLKSKGEQVFSYIYSIDAVSASLFLLKHGKSKEAYNVSNNNANISLKELASKMASFNNKKVIFDLPNETEKDGFSKATTAVLNIDKILSLGWQPIFDLDTSISHTIKILRESCDKNDLLY